MNAATTSNQLTHRSPPLGVVAVVFVSLFAASIAVTLLGTHGAPYPTPYRSIAELTDYYTRFPDVLRWTSFLQLGAMMPLGVYSATIVSRLAFHRVGVAGVQIAWFGGVGAALCLGISALCSWTLSQPGVASESGALRVAQLLAFASGGFAHTASLGLLLAGVSLPSLAFRLLPRWLCWSGLILAAIAELSTLAMLSPALSTLLPLARFPAYLWLIATGFALPKTQSSPP